MATNDNKPEGQKKLSPYPFMMSPLKQQSSTPAGGASWHMSQLKKNMPFAATDAMPEGVLKRDGTDSFQITIEQEAPGITHEDDGLKEKVDAENMEIDGEEAFVDREAEEDDANWESEEDYFQDLAERNSLLEEALRERIQSPFPPVYNQIITLVDALVEGKKTIKSPSHYIDELDVYIQKKIKVFSQLPKIDNDAITKSNQLMLDGLSLLLEVCNSLRKYLDGPAPYHVDLIRQLTKQANEFFSEGKNLLLSVKLEDKS
jgi:hypothetical protein